MSIGRGKLKIGDARHTRQRRSIILEVIVSFQFSNVYSPGVLCEASWTNDVLCHYFGIYTFFEIWEEYSPLLCT